MSVEHDFRKQNSTPAGAVKLLEIRFDIIFLGRFKGCVSSKYATFLC